jgi:hypothetical protein
VIGYATRTGTRRNLALLREYGWRQLVSAAHRTSWYLELARYAIDNGAWTAHRLGTPWDASAFSRCVDQLGARADWIVAPDIVCGGAESLALSRAWLGCLPGLRLIAVQDGMQPSDLEDLIGDDVGLFVGGSTEWKERSLTAWGQLSHRAGCYLHVARVNSKRRIRLAALAGADSIDGTSCSRYADTIGKLSGALAQRTLWTGM